MAGLAEGLAFFGGMSPHNIVELTGAGPKQELPEGGLQAPVPCSTHAAPRSATHGWALNRIEFETSLPEGSRPKQRLYSGNGNQDDLLSG